MPRTDRSGAGFVVSVICEESEIVGDMRVAGSLRVDGAVEGDVTATHRVHVGPVGSVRGTIAAREIRVDGSVEGALRGARVHLTPESRMSGAVHTPRLVLEEGARLVGSCEMSPPAETEAAADRVEVAMI